MSSESVDILLSVVIIRIKGIDNLVKRCIPSKRKSVLAPMNFCSLLKPSSLLSILLLSVHTSFTGSEHFFSIQLASKSIQSLLLMGKISNLRFSKSFLICCSSIEEVCYCTGVRLVSPNSLRDFILLFARPVNISFASLIEMPFLIDILIAASF